MAQEWSDGNALAGPLGEVFTVDMTTASGTCASCGMVGPVAGMRVFDHAPGLVARCPQCESVLLRLVRAPGRAWLEMQGMTSLQIQLPDG